jgi:alpha-glucuronidase
MVRAALALALWCLVADAAAAAEPEPPGVDPLWLRYPQVAHRKSLLAYREALGGGVSVTADGAKPPTGATLVQLRAAASELEMGLSGLLGRHVPASCCRAAASTAASEAADGSAAAPAAAGRLLVSVGNASASDRALGPEGFRITRSPTGQVTSLRAASSSGALYGAFRLLGYLQRGEPLPSNLTSIPAMKLRVFDLWDELVRTRPDAYIHSALTCNMIMIQVLLFVCVLTYHCCNRTAASPEVLPASR